MGSRGGSKTLSAKCMMEDAKVKDAGSDYIPCCKDFTLEIPYYPSKQRSFHFGAASVRGKLGNEKGKAEF